MFITTVHLLTSRNFLRELQTSVHIIFAYHLHNSLASSTLGLKCKKKPFRVLVSKSGMRCLMNTKIVKEILQKWNKKSSSQYSRNWRFLHGAWWDNAKIQTQQNWIRLNQLYNIFRTLRNARTFSPLQCTSAIFLFFLFSLFFLAYRFVLSCYISSFPFYFQCN